MKRTVCLIMLLVVVAVPHWSIAQLLPVLGAQRAGTSSFQFLKIGAGARAAAMGESFVAVANDASALFWNPAGITQFSGNEVTIGHANWFVDIKHQVLGAVYHLSTDDAVGLSVVSLHMDDMERTTETQPLGTGTYFTYGDLAVGVSYSRRLTEQFSFGATVRYVEETLDVLKMRGVLVDLGTYYWTGLGTARFSAVVTNFGSQVKPTGTVDLYGGGQISQFQEFTPPTMFRFGFAIEPYQDESNRVTLSAQLNHPNDNSENISLGAEYGLMKSFFLRAGYKINVDEEQFSAGVGVEQPVGPVELGLDYGFAAFARLGNVHRISLLVKL
jgi:Type IX secretion system protein PorV